MLNIKGNQGLQWSVCSKTVFKRQETCCVHDWFFIIIIITTDGGLVFIAAERKLEASDVQNCCCSASLSLFISMHKMFFSASDNIYCLEHYTVHIESDLNEHFVQYTCTFSELFMLVCVDIILTLFILSCNHVQPYFIIVWSIVAVLCCEWESRYMFVMCVMYCKYKVYTEPS